MNGAGKTDRPGDLVPVDVEPGRFGPARPVPAPWAVAPHVLPPAEPVRGIRLTGYATPRVRQHAGDAVVIAYAVAAIAVCVAVVLIASVFGVAAYRVVSWMWPA